VKIIPVIDLLDGLVVHAAKGEREKYRPVESLLVKGSDVFDIARALIKETGCSEIYIADLNAIQKNGSNSRIIKRAGAEFGVSLLVDAAAFDVCSALAVKKSGADTVILGSETFSDMDEIPRITERIPVDELLFSIDISGGKVLSRADELNGADPVEAMDILSEKGMQRFILLTLDMVGSGEGPDTELIERTRKKFHGHTLIAGGGVRYPDHLEQLNAAGADGVLVATSLHNGWIKGEHLLNL
jgi:phosphoribosylformimino-5-aminoimidazole carboxamide ribotide isomerase